MSVGLSLSSTNLASLVTLVLSSPIFFSVTVYSIGLPAESYTGKSMPCVQSLRLYNKISPASFPLAVSVSFVPVFSSPSFQIFLIVSFFLTTVLTNVTVAPSVTV